MKLKKIFCVFFGVLILFIGMWGGSWLCIIFPQGESPFAFAAFFTGFLCVFLVSR
jgi:hypothetical protein